MVTFLLNTHSFFKSLDCDFTFDTIILIYAIFFLPFDDWQSYKVLVFFDLLNDIVLPRIGFFKLLWFSVFFPFLNIKTFPGGF